MLHRLAEMAEWPEHSAWAMAEMCGPAPDLFPQEEAAMARAVPKRRTEFAFGRDVARRAMAGLGYPNRPLPMGSDRAPQWPQGLRGSISHAGDHCIAVASTSQHVASIGVDIEPDSPLPQGLEVEVCSPAELALFKGEERRVFSAKEAIYKAVYPVCQQVFDFKTLEIDKNGAVFTRDLGPFRKGQRLPYAQWLGEGWILSLCVRRRYLH